jgi:hypothetical protein
MRESAKLITGSRSRSSDSLTPLLPLSASCLSHKISKLGMPFVANYLSADTKGINKIKYKKIK